jgi:hypothetical protein
MFFAVWKDYVKGVIIRRFLATTLIIAVLITATLIISAPTTGVRIASGK